MTQLDLAPPTGRRGRELGVYGFIFITLLGFGLWLGIDLADGRQRIIADRTQLAIQKSQFMSQWFGSNILAADYVLRGINDKVGPGSLDPDKALGLSGWLTEKTKSVPGVVGITIYDETCVFVAAADPGLIGFRSNQKVCVERPERIEDRLHVQYVPAEKSASKRAVVLASRHRLSPDGQLLGGALAAIDLGFARDWIGTFDVGADDVLAVVDGDGILLARNPHLPEAIGKRTPSPAGQPSFGETRSSAGFIAVSPLDGRQRIYGISKIEDVPMVIIVGFDMSGSLAEWRRRAWQLSAGYFSLVILSLLALRAHMTALHQREEMRRLATTDALTGVSNRRHFVSAGVHETQRASRYGSTLSVLMVDIDHFKAINDTWGHATGDRAIQSLARNMVAPVRDQDIVGRLGGEEFAILLPETCQDGARTIAERLRLAVQDDSSITTADGATVRFTISIGVATYTTGDSFDNLMTRADQALYRAKEGGRNRVVAG
ncbi:GGDEF domain-containing protein [Magnetospirillum sp. UT-4]|uniref:sensor domain-containing diguanylate cyclase n=1 Tax=Magnetospirillum sp. UT-4 TaxID=2681467 RepID=UPI0013810DBC|nr:GGDEF domain-containing protein [Magnetospirillum sp. UT-4]CAA7625897.1 Response regulator [Magnetospirillum sp. UT-4]